MPDTINKLTPDRDLQCYFFQPSSIAALSGASSDGFTVSGTWRQQFDWTVIEWNRDNTHEHPALRNLPDGDLSGLTLTYEETRTNCIPLDSDLFHTVDWPYLRIWAGEKGTHANPADDQPEDIYFVKLNDPAIATPIEGSYQNAYADFTLTGEVGRDGYVGLAYLGEHFTHQLYYDDTPDKVVQAIGDTINDPTFGSPLMKATYSGNTIRIYYTAGASIEDSKTGANGNKIGIYSYTQDAGTMAWDAPAKTLANGTSPTRWRITLPFGSLRDISDRLVPATKIRKLRWTYSADLQAAAYGRSEFQVVVSNWSVTGTGRAYSVAGPGSRRYEEDDSRLVWTGTWMTPTPPQGNYSGGSIKFTQTSGSSVQLTYSCPQTHTLYLGTRYLATGTAISLTVDGAALDFSPGLALVGEDTLIRCPVGEYSAGTHTVVATHNGTGDFYFDFFEVAVPTTDLPDYPDEPGITLATDWDTDHSLALAPERTAWFIDKLGFKGRANNYVGALWFYELVRTGHVYSTATVTFSGTPDPNYFATVTLGRTGAPPESDAVLTKLIHPGDTAETLAIAYAQELNRGYTSVWASASGGVVTIQSRSIGLDGDQLTLDVSTTSAGLTVAKSGANFSGGADGDWRTDLTASPRLNRAVRDWTKSYLTALAGYGIDAASAFSMELQHGDSSATVGIAQMGPTGTPVILPTPVAPNEFLSDEPCVLAGSVSERCGDPCRCRADTVSSVRRSAVVVFPQRRHPSPYVYGGMPFYDDWTKAQFLSENGYDLPVFADNTSDPALYPTEVAFLSGLIGSFTSSIMSYVRATYPTCRFEVLYPTDVNQTTFNTAINFPTTAWTPSALTVLKTESFGFTFGRDLNKAEGSMDFGDSLGFPASQRSHLVGIGDSTAAWLKEAQMAEGKRFESVVLFALDQYCLIGYPTPLPESFRRSLGMAF